MQVYFDGSTNLGAEQQLPDDLFKGLTSLTYLSTPECRFQKLPNMDDLAALKYLHTNGGQFHVSTNESASKFDRLISVDNLNLENNFLARVPSVKNMGNLTTLWLASNQITTIFPGDFSGAKRLVQLGLGGNRITSVAFEAFINLEAFRVQPNKFNPQHADGTPYTYIYGIPLWPHTGLGYFGGNQTWSLPPIIFAPNPVQCLWVGPLVSDFNCSHCALGYEAASADNATCIKPVFRGSAERAQLQLRDSQGAAVKDDANTGTLTLLTDRAYTIRAPKLLEQKGKMFVGTNGRTQRSSTSLISCLVQKWTSGAALRSSATALETKQPSSKMHMRTQSPCLH